MLHGAGREEGAANRRRPESSIRQEYVPHPHKIGVLSDLLVVHFTQ